MDSAAVREKLVDILYQIQTKSGLECPMLTGDTKPVATLPEFDSKVWPVATTLLADGIGGNIDNDINIFFDKTTKEPLTIDEIVALVCHLLENRTEKDPET